MAEVKKHKHSIYDTDPHFKIDPISMAITTDSKKLSVMKGDHNCERFTFEIPKEIEGHDMSLCDKIQIHYLNFGSSVNRVDDIYEVDDFQVSPDSDDVMIFSWLLDGNTCKYDGTLSFAIVFKCTDEDVTTYQKSTDIFKGIAVKDTINNGDTVVEEHSDILQQWYDKLFNGEEDDPVDENEETDAKYFDIDYDGIVSLKPQYRGSSEKSNMPYSISDNGLNNVGSKINELPENIVIPDVIGTTAVTGFQEGMFNRNIRVKRIVIPKAVTSLPANFVCRAIHLESLENTEQVTNLGNTSIAYTNLKEAHFPNLKTMGTATFANSSNMVIVDIGNNVTEIPTGAFNQIENLSHIVGGANVTKIGTKAFAIDRRLRNLSFLSNLTSIGQQAFYDSRVNFENAYQTLVANGCTFGTDATYKQINGNTDYWTGVEYTPCENPLRSLFHQKNPRWNDLYIGTTNQRYGPEGCSMISMAEIYSALEQVDLESPMEFVDILEEKNIDYSNFQRKDGVASIMSSLGYETEIIPNMTSANLKKIYDALNDGALIWKVCMIYGNNSDGHANLVYGVNGIGELLISDSSLQNYNLEEYKNHLSSMPIYTTGNSNMYCVIVKKK